MEIPPEVQIVWDEHNLFHLLTERGHRGITVEDVEQVLTDPDTRSRTLPTGADLHIGRGPTGRPLAVITVSVAELYPKTAWWLTEKTWRKAHDHSV
ncbi:MAG: hypothetical protein M3Z66_09045 [Chloroflexota bacterium]|nr:hypothetical protein [Chloroflexota bacterium]